ERERRGESERLHGRGALALGRRFVADSSKLPEGTGYGFTHGVEPCQTPEFRHGPPTPAFAGGLAYSSRKAPAAELSAGPRVSERGGGSLGGLTAGPAML